MALHVKTNTASYLGIPIITGQTGSTFTLPAGTKRVKVFRNAGIIYEGISPDEYVTSHSGIYIKSISLNTALTSQEILEIDCFS